MTVNFHEEIRILKEKLNECENSLVSFKISYRKMHDTIDTLHKSNYDEKEQIRLIIHTINDILSQLDLNTHIVDLEDVKKLKNIESLIVINNALHHLTDVIGKRLLKVK